MTNEYKKPLPEIQPFSQAFWDGTRERKLLIQHCNACDSNIFYPRRECPECWSKDLGWIEASGQAEIFAFSITYEGVEEMFAEDLPIVLAWVDLPEGIRMQTNIVDCNPETVVIGMPVEVVFRDVTEEITLPYFRPVENK
jgi:uncharacterized OB-fold protein